MLRTLTQPVPQPRTKEQEEGASLVERRRQTRREILKSCLYGGVRRLAVAGLIGGTIAAREYQVKQERKTFAEIAERNRLGESLREFVAQFRSGELLIPLNDDTALEIQRYEKPQKVVICLTDIEVASLPQIADALAEKGVALRHVLRTDKEARDECLYRNEKSIWIENLSSAKYRLSRKRGEKFEYLYDGSEHRRHLLQAIASYDSVTSENPDYAQNVVVILRAKATEKNVNGRSLIDDLWNRSVEGGPEYVIMEIGKKRREGPPSPTQEPASKLVVAK